MSFCNTSGGPHVAPLYGVRVGRGSGYTRSVLSVLVTLYDLRPLKQQRCRASTATTALQPSTVYSLYTTSSSLPVGRSGPPATHTPAARTERARHGVCVCTPWTVTLAQRMPLLD